MATVIIDREILFIERGRVWRIELGGAGIAAAADYKLGVVTGSTQLVVTNRSYSATSSKLTVGLYATSFTGGAIPRITNRRLAIPVSAAPAVTVLEGVTATLNTVITQATILAGTSTGNAQAAFFGESTAIILKPNTSYVVSLRNDGASSADIGMAFDMRTDELLTTTNETS